MRIILLFTLALFSLAALAQEEGNCDHKQANGEVHQIGMDRQAVGKAIRA